MNHKNVAITGKSYGTFARAPVNTKSAVAGAGRGISARSPGVAIAVAPAASACWPGILFWTPKAHKMGRFCRFWGQYLRAFTFQVHPDVQPIGRSVSSLVGSLEKHTLQLVQA